MNGEPIPFASQHLARHEAELEALRQISRLLAKHAAQRQLLGETLAVLERQLDLQRATVMLLSPDGHELAVEATRCAAASQPDELRYRFGEGITGSVAESGNAALVPQVSEEPAFRNRIHKRTADESERLGFVCVPIVLDGESMGTLSADVSNESTNLLNECARFLEIVAGMIAYDMQARREASLERRSLEAENLWLRSALGEDFRPDNLVGNSRGMREIYRRVQQVAASDTTVLIRGESGTGKELIASAIHYASPRKDRAFVRVNCAALSEGLLESELFGHEKGAFTGALYHRIGRIEEAEGGTFFLDEIGDFSPAIQVKLLRILQEREYERVGSNQTQKADVRVVAATNRDLEQLVEDNSFRQDLYYRINVVPIFLPPLRERRNDILLLADHFVEKYSDRMGKRVARISTPAINMMVAYHWPGNVRELENCVEHAVLMTQDGVIQGHHLPPTLQTPQSSDTVPSGSLKVQVQQLERDLILDALKCSEGNMAAAARQLGITARMIRYKISNLNIDYERFFPDGDAPQA